MTARSDSSAPPRSAWVLHLLASGFVAASGLYLITTPDERNIGIISSGFAVLGVMMSLGAFRSGRRFAWRAMWVYPATFGAVALSLFLSGEVGIGAYYLGLAILGLLAQVLSSPLIEPE